MRRRRFFESLTAALLAVLVIGNGLALAAPPEGKGGGGGGGDTGDSPATVTPPVRYSVKTFGMPADYSGGGSVYVYQMTSSGIVVGDYPDLTGFKQPFIYDPSIDTDVAINLNDLGIVGIPEGWRILSATDINELGYAVGPLQSLADPGLYRGYLLDLTATPPAMSTLPDGPSTTYARRINDMMDIVGAYQREDGTWGAYSYNPAIDTATNDLGISLWGSASIELSNPVDGSAAMAAGRLSDGSSFRLALGGELEILAELLSPSRIEDINPHGDVCGVYTTSTKKSTTNEAFRYTTGLQLFSEFGGAVAITAHGDLVLTTNSGLYLHHDGTGAISLDEVAVGDESDLADWFGSTWVQASDMTERGAINPDVPDYPGICGLMRFDDASMRGWVLTPVPAQ